jgi:hypothetical protein
LPAFPTSVVFDNGRATARLSLPHSVLLDCLHLDSQKPDSAILASLRAADWEQLEALATQGSVRFQFYQRLQQPRLQSTVPTALLERLQVAAHEQTLRVLGLEATLVEILGDFRIFLYHCVRQSVRRLNTRAERHENHSLFRY